jgi:hypothetical protein
MENPETEMSAVEVSSLDSLASISISADEGAEMKVLHPVSRRPMALSDGTPVTVKLAGADSARFRKVQRGATDRRLKMAANNRRAVLNSADIESDGLDSLVACTLSWTGIVLDGKPVECNPANVKMVYLKMPWLKEQVDEFIGDRANFLRE